MPSSSDLPNQFLLHVNYELKLLKYLTANKNKFTETNFKSMNINKPLQYL